MISQTTRCNRYDRIVLCHDRRIIVCSESKKKIQLRMRPLKARHGAICRAQLNLAH